MQNIILDKILNPEFKKNLWLEISLQKLIIMPSVLAGIFFIAYLANSDIEGFMRSMWAVSTVCFGIIVFVWGGKLASESVINEVNDKTWEFQKMTLISPVEMLIGKVFGSTIYTWYGGIFCVIAYLIAAFYLTLDNLGLRIEYIKILASSIMFAILIHTVAISISLVEIKKNPDKTKISSAFALIVIVMAFFWIFPSLLSITRYSHEKDIFIKWYIFEFKQLSFVVFTVFIYLIWSIIGLYRNIKSEMQM